jgi:translation initiation factor 1
MDPFATTEKDDPFASSFKIEGPKEKIHIRYYKQGPRTITMIEGLDDDLDQKRIAKALKGLLKCASSVHANDEGVEVIKLQGDHCMAVKDWLIAQEILTTKEAAERLVIHRF